jgi:hypothetical protein
MTITGTHADHSVTYNMVCTVVQSVLGIDEKGDVQIRGGFGDTWYEAITDSFLYCETCDERLHGSEIGAAKGWQAY